MATSTVCLNDPSLFIDPATGNIIGTCPESASTDTQRVIHSAAAALPAWRFRAGRNRGRILRRWYELILKQQDLATLITLENGKAKSDAEGKVLFAASFLEWFSEEAARIYGDVLPHTQPNFRVSVLNEPVGVCGLTTPYAALWNFPAAMITRKLGPALAAGCTVVVKTAGETPFTANALIKLGERAGIPPGVVNSVTALASTVEIGQTLFIGYRPENILHCGNPPFIVFEDADLGLAVEFAIASKFKSSGQTCVRSNRIFVQKSVYREIIRRLKDAVSQFRVGSGFDEKTTHGPLITPAAVAGVAGLVDDAVRRGATLEAGSNFFEPTILTNVTPDMTVVNEEIFGPVAPIFRFDTEDEVIAASNAYDVGLASCIFTQDVTRANRVSELLQFGMVVVNTSVISDAASSFGGIKHSGMGREGSKYGIEDYLQMKTVVTRNINVIHKASL
ncbi:hypothetical protein BDW74DRAFT_174348 [Aspergillus multicolor]|uniref:NAD-dependent succinate-semialdehyde dehydrogenase n=1 Tax=Aspergillus multicolor TaxID=41759 RepID=UPI003CCDD0DB